MSVISNGSGGLISGATDGRNVQIGLLPTLRATQTIMSMVFIAWTGIEVALTTVRAHSENGRTKRSQLEGRSAPEGTSILSKCVLHWPSLVRFAGRYGAAAGIH